MTLPPHDRVPPPPHEAHGPGLCLDCQCVVTMHYTGRCRSCGDWLVGVEATEVVKGDVFLNGAFWDEVAAVAPNDKGNVVITTGNGQRVGLRPSAHVWIAAHQRPKVGVLA